MFISIVQQRAKKEQPFLTALMIVYKSLFVYLATRSSHLTMKIMVNIEIAVAITKIDQVIQIGIASYKIAPINRSPFPSAVAPSQPPCINPWYCGGETLDTNEIPIGLINNSAIVRIK